MDNSCVKYNLNANYHQKYCKDIDFGYYMHCDLDLRDTTKGEDHDTCLD